MANRNGAGIPACVWAFLGVLIVGLLRGDPLPAIAGIGFFLALGLVVYVLERRFPVLTRPVPGNVTVRAGRREIGIPLGAILVIALCCILIDVYWFRYYAK
jgi:hypothetical protein